MEMTLVYRGHSGLVLVVAWSSDSAYIVSGSRDGTAQVWNAGDGRTVSTYEGHKGYVSSLQWSPDGKWIASGGGDASMQIWDAATGQTISTYRVAPGDDHSISVAWSPDSTRLALATGRDYLVYILDAATKYHLLTYTKHTVYIRGLTWSPDSKQIGSATGSGVDIWDAETGRTIYSVPDCINDVKWSPDGNWIALAAAAPGGVPLLDAATGSVLKRLPHSGNVGTVAWSPDSKLLASGAENSLKVWDVSTGKMLSDYLDQRKLITDIAWSPDGTRLASSSWDGTVWVRTDR
jgi:WD40 repeat protein